MKLTFNPNRPLEVKNDSASNKDSAKADKFDLDCRIKEWVGNSSSHGEFTNTCGCNSTNQVISCGC